MAKVNSARLTNVHTRQVTITYGQAMTIKGSLDLCDKEGFVYASTEQSAGWSPEAVDLAHKLAAALSVDIARVIQDGPTKEKKKNEQPAPTI